MDLPEVRIVPVFNADDQAWIRRTSAEVPRFWHGHSVAPALGDVLRVGGRQFVILARVWEQDGSGSLLRLYLGSGHALSDTTFS